MNKMAKILDETTGLCSIAQGTNKEFLKSIGYKMLDVEQSNIDNLWYLSDKCPMKTPEQLEVDRQERLNNLSLTGADVERAIYKAKGMDFEDIINYIVTYEIDIDLKALRIELKANHFYRGNPYINQIGALLGFSEKQLDEFFDTGDYEKLLPDNEPLEDDEIPF